MSTPVPADPDFVLADQVNARRVIMPCQLTVFCDCCGTEHTGDYLVGEDDDAATRFGYARRHLTEHQGWRCDARGDFCPECAS